jgi:hypothetical protein
MIGLHHSYALAQQCDGSIICAGNASDIVDLRRLNRANRCPDRPHVAILCWGRACRKRAPPPRHTQADGG